MTTGEPRTGVIRQALELARSIAITGEPWSEQAGTVWLAALTALDAIEREAAAATEPRSDPALDFDTADRLLYAYGYWQREHPNAVLADRDKWLKEVALPELNRDPLATPTSKEASDR